MWLTPSPTEKFSTTKVSPSMSASTGRPWNNAGPRGAATSATVVSRMSANGSPVSGGPRTLPRAPPGRAAPPHRRWRSGPHPPGPARGPGPAGPRHLAVGDPPDEPAEERPGDDQGEGRPPEQRHPGGGRADGAGAGEGAG